MNKMNCRQVRREIEETSLGEMLTSTAYNHLQQCRECETFSEDRTKLREMVANLGTVSAPGDFEFRLRARLANEKSGVQRSAGSWSLGYRAAAFAILLLAVGTAFLLVNFKRATTPELATQISIQAPSTVAPSNPALSVDTDSSSVTAVAKDFSTIIPANNPSKRRTSRSGQLATIKEPRKKTIDFSSTQAAVYRQAELADGGMVFPINASTQSLKVSGDNARGNPRTISLPTVSFGSQRSVSQNPTTLMASSRGAW